MPNINFCKISSPTRNPAAGVLFERSFEINLLQTVTEPSGAPENSSTVSDLLLVSSHQNNYTIIIHDEMFDHKLVYFYCDLTFIESNAPTASTFIDFTDANDEFFFDYIQEYLDSIETKKIYK